MKEIWLAGGCFWGAQHYFNKIDGIVASQTGFANGHTPDPIYKEVYTDTTGYAETVYLEYDESVISLESILKYFFCAIDPVSVNQQGEDKGTRYRTGIYYKDEKDLPVIRKVYDAHQALYDKPFAVEVEPLRNFYAADEYHQDYLVKHPDGYCHLPLKIFRYPELLKQLRSLSEGEDDMIALMADFSALIQDSLKFFWTGFYIVKGEALVLGPFQGPVACTRIPYGKGVCGTAWKREATVVVPDVEKFPGHIACSSLSRSEIVVPVKGDDGKVKAVLDIDSKELETFDKIDACWLEKAAAMIGKICE